MNFLTLAPRGFLDEVLTSQRETVRLVRETDWSYVCADLKTNMQRVFAKFAWVALQNQHVEAYVKLSKEERQMPTPGRCEAKGCTREAYVRVQHYVETCDWSLLVCSKHEEPAKERLALHLLECLQTAGNMVCHVCKKTLASGETYQRYYSRFFTEVPDPEDENGAAKWMHSYHLTDNGANAKVVPGQTTLKGNRGVKDPVTKRPIKADDGLPDDLEELEPEGLSFEDLNDDSEDEVEPKAKQKASRNGKADRAAKAAKPAKSAKADTAKPEKPTKAKLNADAQTSKRLAAKAKKITSGGELPTRAKTVRQPGGDTTILTYNDGQGGQITFRLNSNVVDQWRSAEKSKDVLALIERTRSASGKFYGFQIKSEDEANKYITSMTKAANAKSAPKQFSAALNRAMENIERHRPEIRKF